MNCSRTETTQRTVVLQLFDVFLQTQHYCIYIVSVYIKASAAETWKHKNNLRKERKAESSAHTKALSREPAGRGPQRVCFVWGRRPASHPQSPQSVSDPRACRASVNAVHAATSQIPHGEDEQLPLWRVPVARPIVSCEQLLTTSVRFASNVQDNKKQTELKPYCGNSALFSL